MIKDELKRRLADQSQVSNQTQNSISQNTQMQDTSPVFILLLVLVILIICLFFAGVIYFWRKKIQKAQIQKLNEQNLQQQQFGDQVNQNSQNILSEKYQNRGEIPTENIQIIEIDDKESRQVKSPQKFPSKYNYQGQGGEIRTQTKLIQHQEKQHSSKGSSIKKGKEQSINKILELNQNQKQLCQIDTDTQSDVNQLNKFRTYPINNKFKAFEFKQAQREFQQEQVEPKSGDISIILNSQISRKNSMNDTIQNPNFVQIRAKNLLENSKNFSDNKIEGQIQYKEQDKINVNDINFQIKSSQIDLKSPQKMEINKDLKITKLNSSSKKKGDGYLKINTGSISTERFNLHKIMKISPDLENFQEKEDLLEKYYPQYGNGFQGIKTFIDHNCRKQLPHLTPPNYTVPIWKVVGKFITQDLSRISLPVILNEPLNTIQKMCEMQVNIDLLEEAANNMPEQGEDSTIHSCKRLIACTLYTICQFSFQTIRQKKIFNPLLGETYEFVNDRYKYFGEQVSHHPPVTAYCFEGKGYECEGVNKMKNSFKIGGGSGQLVFSQIGLHYLKLHKYLDDIIISKPNIQINNLIFGSIIIDLEGTVQALNKTTGDFCQINCTPKSWTQLSNIQGYCTDKNGKKQYEVSGTWQNEVILKNLNSGITEVIWKKPDMFPEDFNRQYQFNKLSIQLNYLPQDIKDAKNDLTKCLIAPTDSRFRGDIRLFEQGQMQEADEEKIRLEIKQRKARQEMEDSGTHFVPNFFDEVEEENQLTQQKEFRYLLKQGSQNYWERRKIQNWQNLPDLF